MTVIRRQAGPTLTAVEMDHGDGLEFTLANGTVRRIELAATAARIIRTTLQTPGSRKTEGGPITGSPPPSGWTEANMFLSAKCRLRAVSTSHG
ncbi:MAG: hypothetical protein ABIF71_04185 [Planctomycetota bacterium]